VLHVLCLWVLITPFKTATKQVPPLWSMSDAAIQQLADQTWSRRDRWSHFAEYVKLATAYHPDRGSLPSALRAYSQQNALQPYADTSFPMHDAGRCWRWRRTIRISSSSRC
jgi:hypothetical protein